MNQQTPEQEWNQLMLRITKFTDSLLREDVPAIEHKSNIVALLQAPPVGVRKSQTAMANDGLRNNPEAA